MAIVVVFLFVTRNQFFEWMNRNIERERERKKKKKHLHTSTIYLQIPCPVFDNQSACRVSGLCCPRSKWLCSIAHAQHVTAIINIVFHAKRERWSALGLIVRQEGKPYSHLAAQGLLGRVWCWRNRAWWQGWQRTGKRWRMPNPHRRLQGSTIAREGLPIGA